MTASDAERAAMRRALALAASSGVPLGPNPRVGCVLLAPDGSTVAEGYHGGAGTPHAEVEALARAGGAARGATAVVTLEPCNHTGRTGPCTQALVAAGIRRVVVAQRDSNPVATGGTEALRAAGVDVESGLLADEARALNRVWSFAVEHGRPFVTWKFAATLDGRSAAADGSSRWASSPASRRGTPRPPGVVGGGTPTGSAVSATWSWPAPARFSSTTLSSPSVTPRTGPCPGIVSRSVRSWGSARCRLAAGSSTTPRRPSYSKPGTRPRHSTVCTPGTGSMCSSRAGRRSRQPSSGADLSTRWC